MADRTGKTTARRPGIVTILLAILVLFLLPTLLVVGVFIYEIRRSDEAQSEQYLNTEIRGLANGLSGEIDEAQLFMRVVRRALGPLVERGDSTACQSQIAELQSGDPTLTGYYVTDAAGTIVCAADESRVGTSIASTSAFQALQLGGRLYLGGPTFDAHDRAMVPVALKWLGSAQEFAGVVGAEIDLATVLAKVRTSYALPEAVVMLTSSDGLILSMIPDPGGQTGSRIAPGGGTPFVDGVERRWSDQQVALANDVLVVTVGVPRTIVEARTNQIAWWTVGALLAIVVAGLLIAFIAASYFVRRPVHALADAAERLGSGDRSARAGTVGGARELAGLGQAFDTMADRLDGREAENERYRRELEQARDELEVRVEERTRDLAAMTDKAELRARTVERRFEQEMRLREIVTLLQACQDLDESAAILKNLMPDLFPSTRGALALFSEPHNELETIAQWGTEGSFAESFMPDACWALRLGNGHRSGMHGEGNPRCAHIENPDLDVVCAPILVQGETRGVVSVDLQGLPEEIAGAEGEHAVASVETAATTIGIALYNIRLRGALRKLTIRDPLTGLHNRRFADDVVAKELSRARRSRQPVTVVRIDVDRFKAINDEFGFDAGDTVLREMAGAIEHFFRYEDVCSRYGGQDFLIVMVGASKVDAVNRCDQLREQLGERSYFYKGMALPRISVSIGVATYPEDGTTEDDLLTAVEAALSTAKHDGRDRVRAAPGEALPPPDDTPATNTR
ncbi:diguanylate cyclase [Amorphus sp. 3PC139-8]|uniref:diguanylate cyclase n=1 Tax=Amorphus sp. 3PC139-8 TaxID=2735676 RepID=UPI00345D91E3